MVKVWGSGGMGEVDEEAMVGGSQVCIGLLGSPPFRQRSFVSALP